MVHSSLEAAFLTFEYNYDRNKPSWFGLIDMVRQFQKYNASTTSPGGQLIVFYGKLVYEKSNYF